jgi:transcriptional regulator with XRE-family HTH domain
MGLTMKLDNFLKGSGWTRADLSRKLGISKPAISKWDEVPLKWVSVLEGILVNEVDLVLPPFSDEVEELAIVPLRHVVFRGWRIKGEKVYWQRRWWGRGSERDFEFSAATLVHIRKYIKVHGLSGAVQILSTGGADFNSELLREVRDNVVCPVIVDELEPRFAGGASVPFRCNPWKVTTKLGEGYKPGEYFSQVVS